MKKIIIFSAIALIAMSSCKTHKFLDSAAPEERALNMMKVTDEEKTTVLRPSVHYGFPRDFATTRLGGSKAGKINWECNRILSTSPNGDEIAYLTRENKQDNIMIRRTSANSSATQRTFRNVTDFTWGADDKLYFSDGGIAMIDAHSGSLVRQLTSNSSDCNPSVTSDGKLVYFCRSDRTGPSIWSLNLDNGSLTQCAAGYQPCTIGNEKDRILCTRNNTSGSSEIWIIDYVLGQETILLSDKNISYSHPSISPDGQWVVCQGNCKSPINKKENIDIYAIRIDGTGYIQLTYHPAQDQCPVFSSDGRHIYFISDRANKDEHNNIWRMNFNGGY